MKWHENKITWQESNLWGGILVGLYILLAILPLILAYGFSPASDKSFFMELGNGAGLLGFSLLTLQFVMTARIKFIERPFGLDLLMNFHKQMGILIGALILLHPFLLSLSHKSWSLFSLDTSWQVNLGKVATLFLILLIIMALLFRKIRMDYNVWRLFHKAAIVVLVLGFIHSILIGEDLQNNGMKAYWITLFAIGIFVFMYRNIYVPLWGGSKYQVIAVKQETPDTWTLELEPVEGEASIIYRPGQFAFLKLKRPGRMTEEHPFTIASSPTELSGLKFTIKESGNFTNTIGETKPGDLARIEAPFGCFSHTLISDTPLIFIAGGVGVTPMISMLRYLRDTKDSRDVVVIHGIRGEDDILFKEELNNLPASVKVVHVMSCPGDNCTCEQGYVSADIIKKYTVDILGHAHIYFCGPPLMVNGVLKSLHKLNVGSNRIHFERFSI